MSNAEVSVHGGSTVVYPTVPDTPGELLHQGFPEVEGVQLAAAAFADLSVLPGWDGSEGRQFYVEVGPGLVALRSADRNRRERRADNDRLAAFDSWAAGHQEAAHRAATAKLRARERSPQDLHLGDKGYAGFLDADAADERRQGGERSSWREVTAWSAKSRRRLMRTVAELDYRPLFALGVPAMVTLTYPGSWEQLAPNGKTAKRHFRLLQKRWHRRWGSELMGLWKLEFQRRGAPHFHVFCVPPGEARVFRAWLSITWAEIVKADQSSGERRRHVLAGTAVDYAEAARMRDPRRLAVYFLKHGTKTKDDKEYQHDVPKLWQAPGAGPGRFWGYLKLSKAVSWEQLHVEDFVVARRTLRRWSRAQGRTRQLRVDRVQLDVTTGELTSSRRSVTRRTYQLRGGSLVGGWIVCNSGPALGQALALALRC